MAVQDDSPDPDIPEQSWSNPFTPETYLHDTYDEIVKDNRDLVIIVDDFLGRRGTGKTVASLQLANAMDQTEEGLTQAKATMEPEELRMAYTEQPKRSGLVFDEGEIGASNKDAMTKTNKALREIMSMGRVEQKYVVINAPLKDFLDKDLRKLCEVWVSMTRKGGALVHRFKWETYSKTLLTPQKQTISFQDIPSATELRDVYNYLTREKRKKIRGDDDSGFIPTDEHKELLRKAKDETERETRDELIREFYHHPRVQESDITQEVIGDIVGITQQQVANIV